MVCRMKGDFLHLKIRRSSALFLCLWVCGFRCYNVNRHNTILIKSCGIIRKEKG